MCMEPVGLLQSILHSDTEPGLIELDPLHCKPLHAPLTTNFAQDTLLLPLVNYLHCAFTADRIHHHYLLPCLFTGCDRARVCPAVGVTDSSTPSPHSLCWVCISSSPPRCQACVTTRCGSRGHAGLLLGSHTASMSQLRDWHRGVRGGSTGKAPSGPGKRAARRVTEYRLWCGGWSAPGGTAQPAKLHEWSQGRAGRRGWPAAEISQCECRTRSKVVRDS